MAFEHNFSNRHHYIVMTPQAATATANQKVAAAALCFVKHFRNLFV